MNEKLLDTDTFSEVTKAKNLNVIAKASAYQKQFGRYTIASITVMEVVKGLHKREQPLRVQQFVGLLGTLKVLDFDAAAAELAGRIFADLERTGQTIGRADPMIAAVALRQGMTLVTGNKAHYQRIQTLGYALLLENWRD